MLIISEIIYGAKANVVTKVTRGVIAPCITLT